MNTTRKGQHIYQSLKRKKQYIVIGLFVLFGISIAFALVLSRNAYQSIQMANVEKFESIWNHIYDKNSKTLIDSKLTETRIKQLEAKAITPNQKKQANLAKATYQLETVMDKPATLTEYIEALNQYMALKSYDNDFPEQETINNAREKELTMLVTSVDETLKAFKVVNNTLVYDQNILKFEPLKTTDTRLNWTEKNKFNVLVQTLNSNIDKQIKQNNLKLEQEKIIDLKGNLDAFIHQVNMFKAEIQTNYLSIAEFKKILKTLTQINVSKHTDWFNGLHVLQSNAISDTQLGQFSNTYNVTLSNQFFIDNPDAQPYKDLLQAIQIPVNRQITIQTTYTAASEHYSEEYTYNLVTSLSNIGTTDSDYINKSALSKIKIKINQEQKATIYIQQQTTSTTTVSTTSSYRYSTNSETIQEDPYTENSQ